MRNLWLQNDSLYFVTLFLDDEREWEREALYQERMPLPHIANTYMQYKSHMNNNVCEEWTFVIKSKRMQQELLHP